MGITGAEVIEILRNASLSLRILILALKNGSVGAIPAAQRHGSRAAPAKSLKPSLSKVSHGRKRHMPDL
jgi:hypothetical protein